MFYKTSEGHRVSDSDVALARLLLAHSYGKSLSYFPISELKRVLYYKERLSSPLFEFELYDSAPFIRNNDFIKAYNLVPQWMSNRARFERTANEFFEKENEIIGDINNPRYFSIGGEVISDSELLVAYEIIKGVRKKTIDKEVQFFIDKCVGLEEVPQDEQTINWLIGHDYYFHAIKILMKKGKCREFAIGIAYDNSYV